MSAKDETPPKRQKKRNPPKTMLDVVEVGSGLQFKLGPIVFPHVYGADVFAKSKLFPVEVYHRGATVLRGKLGFDGMHNSYRFVESEVLLDPRFRPSPHDLVCLSAAALAVGDRVVLNTDPTKLLRCLRRRQVSGPEGAFAVA